jgi:hypothetical protein
MPTISMFYGILVTLFYEDNNRHHTPHFHVRYQGSKASIAIDDGRKHYRTPIKQKHYRTPGKTL